MNFSRLFFFCLLATVFWFLVGEPYIIHFDNGEILGPKQDGVFYLISLFYLFSIIYNNLIFKIFNGDSFTYGVVGQVTSLVFGIPSLFLIALINRLSLNFDGNTRFIPVIILLSLAFAIFAVPIFSTNNVESLPNKSNRRDLSSDGFIKK